MPNYQNTTPPISLMPGDVGFSFNNEAFPGGAQAGSQFAIPSHAGRADTGNAVRWQTIFGTAPTAVNLVLQGAMADVDAEYQTIDTTTATAGEARTITGVQAKFCASSSCPRPAVAASPQSCWCDFFLYRRTIHFGTHFTHIVIVSLPEAGSAKDLNRCFVGILRPAGESAGLRMSRTICKPLTLVRGAAALAAAKAWLPENFLVQACRASLAAQALLFTLSLAEGPVPFVLATNSRIGCTAKRGCACLPQASYLRCAKP